MSPALYPKWFNPVKQKDGSLALLPVKPVNIIGKMPVGATFFDQFIFPDVEGHTLLNYKNIGSV